jgi:hypothetical protein
MAKSSKLFELIKTFNKAEKRYFKTQTRQFNAEEQSNYEELFNLIEAQETYDEGAIISQLSNRSFAKNLSAGKNYLYNFLLKCLRNYHSGKLARISVREMIINTLILIHRRLNDQAMKLMNKAEKMARKHDLFIELLSINLLQRILYRSFTEKGSEDTVIRLQEDFDLFLEKIEYEQRLQCIYEAIYTISRTRQFSPDQIESLEQRYHKMGFPENKSNMSFNELSIRIFTEILLNRKAENFVMTQDIHEEALVFFQDNPHFIKEYQARYINFIANIIGHYLINREYEKIAEKLNLIEAIEPLNSQLMIIKFDNLYYTKIIYLLVSKQFEKTIELAPEVWQFLRHYRHQLSNTRSKTIAVNLSNGLFMAKDFEASLDGIDFILNEFDIKTKPEANFLALRLQILNHFELNNDLLVTHQMRNILRKYRSGPFREALKPTMDVLRKIIRQPASKADLLREHAATVKHTILTDDIISWINHFYPSPR